MNTVIFQAAKLGNIDKILAEINWAKRLVDQQLAADYVYGISGGSLVALAFSLTLSASRFPQEWGKALTALHDLENFLRKARSRHVRAININPWYGPYNLKPLAHWMQQRLQAYSSYPPLSLLVSQLPVKLYLCTIDRDGTFTPFGAENPSLKFQYHAVQVGPPQDAPVLDALMAALSTLLSTTPTIVNGGWYRDCRPAIVDASAIIFDLHRSESKQINSEMISRTKPHAPVRTWKQNWITSSFIMHSQSERNQTLLAAYYMDLQSRQFHLERQIEQLGSDTDHPRDIQPKVRTLPKPGHIDLPYVGSTEAFTNMRQSVENKAALMARFKELLAGQLDNFPFDQPANVIYGAGGFSGILAGLVTTRAVDAGFAEGGGEIKQIYGVSAGVLNGFFHAVQIAAARHPDLYRPAARQALDDLENFIASITRKKIASVNPQPSRFWRGWANLNPLRQFIVDRLAAYTGSKYPDQITFDDIGLPMTIAAARLDGFTDFLGMTSIDRMWHIGGREWRVLGFPIADSILAGWSMNTYILPTRLGNQSYTDGGGTFYDPAVFVACMDTELTSLLNIHLDEPDGHSYNLPPRPNLLRILFDTHNYNFPEERRRMRALTDLLYQHYELRDRYHILVSKAPAEVRARYPDLPDFRRTWEPEFALPVDLEEIPSL